MTPAPPVGFEWAAHFAPEVTRVLSDLSPSAQQLLVAHAALECGWGQASAWRHGFNFGNLTAGAGYQGASWTEPDADWEYAADGSRKRIPQTWRAYATVGDALLDYWHFLGWPRYRPARDSLVDGNLSSFVSRLHQGGYFTLPAMEYQARLEQCLYQVQRCLSTPAASTPQPGAPTP